MCSALKSEMNRNGATTDSDFQRAFMIFQKLFELLNEVEKPVRKGRRAVDPLGDEEQQTG